jgi:hypothetical protein
MKGIAMRPDGTQNVRTLAMIARMAEHDRICPRFEQLSDPTMTTCSCGIATEVRCGVCSELLITMCKPGVMPCEHTKPGDMV